MAFRGKEMMKKVLKKVGENNLAPGVKESLKKCIPDSKVVMNRAKRGIFAGRHIQFGNRVSEDGGNKYEPRNPFSFSKSLVDSDSLRVWMHINDFPDYMVLGCQSVIID